MDYCKKGVWLALTEQEHPVDYLPELALGVLQEDLAPAIREHVAACESCQAEFTLMTGAAKLLPFAVREAEPPAAQRSALMDRIASEPRVLRPVRKARPAWQWFGAVAAAAAIFLAAGGIIGASLFGATDGALTKERDDQRALVQAVAQGTASRQTAEQNGTKATLVFAPGTDSAFAWLEGLPELPEGKAYQAWFIGDSTPRPSNVFASAGKGVWVDSPASVDSFAAFALTIEDDNGAQAPTREPFVVVSLNAAARMPITWEEWIAMTLRD